MKSIPLLLVLFVLWVALPAAYGQEVHHGARMENGTLFFKAEPLNDYILTETQEVYYYVHLQGAEPVVSVPNERIPLNLSVVIDQSGSMLGEKIAYAKEALKYIIRNMGETDFLSIVLYDSRVQVLMEQQRVTDREKWLKLVDGISAGSNTFLEGGIREGYNQVKRAKNRDQGEMVNRVILLSDGRANQGVRDPQQLSAITEDFFKEDQISISTFGVGADYSEDLMSKIAMQGGGNYYFIDSPENLPSMFEEELNGISRVVAKSTKLSITFPGEVLAHKKTYAYNSKVRGNTLEIDFNDVFVDEQKAILVAFSKKSNTKEPLNITCELSYLNPRMSDPPVLVERRTSTLRHTNSPTDFNQGYNQAASEGYALEISAEMYKAATDLCNQHDFKAAALKTKEAIQFLDKHFELNGENQYLRSVQEDLQEYEVLIEEMKRMDGLSFKVNLKRQKHRRFRAVNSPKF